MEKYRKGARTEYIEMLEIECLFFTSEQHAFVSATIKKSKAKNAPGKRSEDCK